MVKLIDHYGINIIKKGKNRYYSPKLKREMIDKVLLEGVLNKVFAWTMASQIKGCLTIG